MTPRQQRTIDQLKEAILRLDGSGPHYEYKKWEVKEHPGFSFVTVYSVVGLKGDEGTIAEVYVRTRRHVSVGPRGGCTLLNPGKGKTKPTGFWAAVHLRTEQL